MAATKKKTSKKQPSVRRADPFSAEERDAMRERAREPKRGGGGEQDLLAKIAAMPEPERALATRLHEVVTAAAPALEPRTWYGMPAWAKNGKVLCFFQSAHKFKTRYATFGFADVAQLDDGTMWPTSFALARWDNAVAARIAALVAKAMG